AIYAAGAEAVRALNIADKLHEQYGIEVKVVNVRTLKPFDSAALQNDLQNMDVFTLEDHVAATGLGMCAAQATAAKPSCNGKKLTTFGLPDDMPITFGSIEKLRQSLQLDEESLVKRIAGSFSKKQ
ncbi:MAG: hypothetical protein J6Q81_04010, partial [Lentisphaeria bacterium]|nr:hypothetical protein [Lentisphaeria bacterium]